MTVARSLREEQDRILADMDGRPFVPAAPAGRFEDWGDVPGEPYSTYKAAEQERRAPAAPRVLGTLDDLLEPAIVRAERRATGKETPIPIAWPTLAPQFGGGLWPGVHVLASGTGSGKTVFCLQQVLHAARAGVPSIYIGLELESLQVALRFLGEAAGVPWSMLYTGGAGPKHFERVRAAVPKLCGLPLHLELGRPQGWPPSELGAVAEAMRVKYPETDGPGSRPVLIVVDFLQILGAEADPSGRTPELRERIGRASYYARDISTRFDAAVVLVSSIARDKYTTISDAAGKVGLAWDTDERGRPTKRRLQHPDVLIGLGKESGEIEFSADSVSVLFPVAGTFREGHGTGVVLATVKGRATGESWSPLLFTKYSYVEPEDGGAHLIDALMGHQQAREEAKAAKVEAKEQKKVDKLDKDARLVVAYVLAHLGCTVTEARTNAVADNARRWAPAVARIGDALVQTPHGKGFACHIDLAKLKAEHKPDSQP